LYLSKINFSFFKNGRYCCSSLDGQVSDVRCARDPGSTAFLKAAAKVERLDPGRH
jgi:hypothetical protein